MTLVRREATEAPVVEGALHCKFTRPVHPEVDMGALAILGQFFVGVGLLLIGVAAIWFVSVQAGRND